MDTSEQIKDLELKIKELEAENRQLHETVDFLTRKLYGTKSEKTSALGIKGQMSLFDEAEVSADENAPEPTMECIESYKRTKRAGHKEELLKDIPHEKRLCTLAEEERFCLTCGTPLHSVGQEFVRSELQFIPAQLKVIDYYVETYECRECRKKGKDYMEKSPMPEPILPHSIASPSSIAWIIHQKYEMAENSIRPFTIGRKNWLFSGSPKGAKTSAGIYTLVETANANGISPMKYIHYILKDLPAFNFREFPEDLEEFLPWNPRIQKLCR